MKLSGGKNSLHSAPAPQRAPKPEKVRPARSAKPEKAQTAAKAKPERARSARDANQRAVRPGRIVLIVVLALIAAVLVAAAAGVNYVGKINTIYPNVRMDGSIWAAFPWSRPRTG